jgi:RNA polymerase sigma-70 factor (ECF subfamily)
MPIFASLSSDASLVRQALEDRPEAFEALILRYQRKAHAIARAIGVPVDSLDDVIQEAFLAAFCGLRDLRSPASFGPWLLGIVRNLSRRHLERSSPAGVRLQENLEPAAGDPFEEEDMRELAGYLDREVLALPEGMREAVLLYYYEGRSARQAAQALGLTTSAVKVRLLRARALFIAASVSMRAGIGAAPLPTVSSPGAASAGAAAGTTGAWGLKGILLGATIMSAKKALILSAVLALFVSGGLLITHKLSSPRSPAAPREAASHGTGAPLATSVPAPGAAEGSRDRTEGSAPARAPRTGISGTVLRDGSPAPAGIQVSAHVTGGWDLVARTATGSDGTYVLEGLEPGRYRLWACKDTWMAGNSDATGEGVEVRDGEVTSGVDLTLVPGAILRGRVVEKASKTAVPGALLTCYVGSTSAGADGLFAIEGVPPGRVFLEVKARGFARVLEFFDNESFVTIELAPGGEIEGVVTDPSGKPSPGAGVHLNWGPTAGVRTDAEGRYLADGIPLDARGIVVTASSEGLHDVQATVPGFPPGESRVALDLRFERRIVLIVLAGRVVDEDGWAVPGAEIHFGSGKETSDEEGVFVIDGAPEGIQSLTARKAGFAPATIYLTDLTPEKREDLRIVLPRGHFLSGVVVDPNGNPVGGAYVDAGSQTRTDAEGRFRLEDLPAMIHHLSVDKEGFAKTVVEPVAADRDDLTVVLAEEGQIRGLAVDQATGAPVGSIRVVWASERKSASGGSSWVVSQKEFGGPEGAFKLSGFAAGQTCNLTVGADGYCDAAVDGVKAWPASESREPIRVEMRRGGTLAGLVVDGASGSPLEGVYVSYASDPTDGRGDIPCWWPAPETLRSWRNSGVETDGNGGFLLKGIPEGSGILLFEKQGYARKAVLPVRPGSGLQTISLAAAARLEGSVRTESGKAIGDAWVGVTVGNVAFSAVKAGEDGSYAIDDLPAGACEVTMERRSPAAHMKMVAGKASLEAGETTPFNIVEPGGSVAGRVTSLSGKPVPDARVNVKSITNFQVPCYVLSTDSDGTFRIGGVPPGRYRVEVELPGEGAAPEGAEKEVEVGSGETACEFSLSP